MLLGLTRMEKRYQLLLKQAEVQVSWLIGPTAMFATALLTTAFLAWTDFCTCGIDYHHEAIADIQEKLTPFP